MRSLHTAMKSSPSSLQLDKAHVQQDPVQSKINTLKIYSLFPNPYRNWLFKKNKWEFPGRGEGGIQWLRLSTFTACGPVVRPLVGELRSHELQVAQIKKKRKKDHSGENVWLESPITSSVTHWRLSSWPCWCRKLGLWAPGPTRISEREVWVK